MGLTLTVLGCCGSYPGPGQACSGYLVRSASTTVLLDAGSGTVANLQRHASIADLDAIVLSHEHPDHWSDVEGIHVAAKYYLDIERIPVYAPGGVRERAYFKGPPLEWSRVKSGDRVRVGDLDLTFAGTDHGPETLAVRVDGAGRSLAYSADAAPGWSFASLGDGIDLALCEATFLSADEGSSRHLSARQAGSMAKEAGVARLLLTHQRPGVDVESCRAEAAGTFGAPVEVAAENEDYDV